jgi:N6-adenosine-specific RNA methylase IME4/ParB-like chromosome segregation protein Spo0J
MSTTVSIPEDIDTEFHEYAHLFPMMSINAHKDLVADIKKNGLLHPLITHEGKIIDGRNRWLACQELGISPRMEELPEGVNPLDYVVSTNYNRRHLSESQRALAAARIITHDIERDTAKSTFKVTSAAVKNAETVLAKGVSGLVDAVEQDQIPVGLAAKIAGLPDEVQEEALTLKVKDLRGIVKKQDRIKKSVKLAKATKLASEKLGSKLYPVIYADPPWQFETWSENGMDRSADNHYDTMSTASIQEMSVPSTDNAVLYLWATVPMLPAALKVMESWGFTYRSQFVWVKDRMGTGYWNRNRHELLLIGVKGNMPAPDPENRTDSVFSDPVAEHSVKPDSVREMIAEAFPSLPKIELFARKTADGWDSHGAEIEQAAIEAEEAPAAQADAAD